MTRILFMGTPEFAVPSLDALLDSGYEVIGAVTQPDRPVGRGHKMQFCPVKQRALERGVEVFQFERLRGQKGLDTVRALKPDLCVTAAFGQILSPKLLAVPRLGTVNVHASLLPAYRGAAPINWCILNGETVSGVTTMLTDAGVDTGDMLLSRRVPILPEETAGELSVRLSRVGAGLLIETLRGYLSGEIVPVKQDESRMSHQPMLDREMGRIDWNLTAEQIALRVRGLDPWPGTFSSLEEGTLKIFRVRPVPDASSEAVPGTVLLSGPKCGLTVACGHGALEILELQAPGGKRMQAKAYLTGKRIDPGTVLGR